MKPSQDINFLFKTPRVLLRLCDGNLFSSLFLCLVSLATPLISGKKFLFLHTLCLSSRLCMFLDSGSLALFSGIFMFSVFFFLCFFLLKAQYDMYLSDIKLCC